MAPILYRHAANNRRDINSVLKPRRSSDRIHKGLEADVWQQKNKKEQVLVLSHNDPQLNNSPKVRAKKLLAETARQEEQGEDVPLILEAKQGMSSTAVRRLVWMINRFGPKTDTHITSFYPGKVDAASAAAQKLGAKHIKTGLNLVGYKFPTSYREFKGQLGRILLLRNTLSFLGKNWDYFGSKVDSIHFPIADMKTNQPYIEALNRMREKKQLRPLEVIQYTSRETAEERKRILKEAEEKGYSYQGVIVE